MRVFGNNNLRSARQRTRQENIVLGIFAALLSDRGRFVENRFVRDPIHEWLGILFGEFSLPDSLRNFAVLVKHRRCDRELEFSASQAIEAFAGFSPRPEGG